MSRNQLTLGDVFDGGPYGPRNGFEARDWQIECVGEYSARVMEWISTSQPVDTAAPPQHRYTVYAGTGTGKTKLAAYLASLQLNLGHVSQIVVVAPNLLILPKTQADFLDYFGIDLIHFRAGSHRLGVPRTKQGYILTYQSLHENPQLHRRLASSPERLMVIFDEVHHLGEKGWGKAAAEAFGQVPYILNLTGTPYRTNNEQIYSVFYEEIPGKDGFYRFRADKQYGFTYSLGRAIAEGVNRKPVFLFHDATVMERFSTSSGEKHLTFDDEDITEAESSLRLRGAVAYGSTDRRGMLKTALERCRAERRKVAIYLGGDTEGEHAPTYDATKLLPDELENLKDLGIGPEDYDVVVGTGMKIKEARRKIREFGASDKWILISVNLVSEGVDIPEVSAEIFLTTVTAKQTTVQRLGRGLRRMGPGDPHKDTLVFMFRHKVYVELAKEINDETDRWQEILLRREREPRAGGERPDGRQRRAEAIGIGDGRLRMVNFHGLNFAAEDFDRKQRELAGRREFRGMPPSILETAVALMLENEHGCG
jgi:superfamily II DNA or RNA helicase